MIYLISNTKPWNLDQRVEHLEVCQISFFNKKFETNDFEALIITSKNAIKFLKINEIEIDKKINVFAIGEASFKACKEFGFENIYLSKNAHGNEFAIEILPFLKGKKALYIKAKETASKLSEILQNGGVLLSNIIAYENLCVKLPQNKKPGKNSILIFTSPKNVESFICNFGFDDSYKCVCIGKTTAKILNEYTKAIVCKTQDINACIDEALRIFTL